jgi:hypothetical protein
MDIRNVLDSVPPGIIVAGFVTSVAILGGFIATLCNRGPGKSTPALPAGPTRDAVLIIDASGSMEEADWYPSRLRGAQDAARAYVERLQQEEPNSRVGVVAFGCEAHLYCDLTELTNGVTVLHAIECIAIQGRTNMKSALKLAHGLLNPNKRVKQVVFLTDGLNTGRDPQGIAARLRGIATIECIGVGPKAQIDEDLLRRMASPYPDGRPRYRWIGDPEGLKTHFHQLAGRIARE